MATRSKEKAAARKANADKKGAKCPFDLQFLTWDFSRDAVAGKGFILR